MSILSLSHIVGNQRGLYQLGERVRSAVAEISKAAEQNLDAPQDSTSVSPQRLQARAAGFREAAQEIARNVGELSLAARGSEEITGKLSELEALARQALEQPDTQSLEKFGAAVKKIRAEIDQTAQKSQFTPPQAQGNKNEAENTKSEMHIKLGSDALLGAKTEISSVTDIRNFMATVQNAAGKLAAIQGDIKSMFESYEMMAVHLEVSMENQVAAKSTLPVDDLKMLDRLLGKPNQAALAQTGHLPPELLNLI